MPTTFQEKSKTLAEIERLGFTYTEHAQFNVTQLGGDKKTRAMRRVQVRESAHYAPKESIERYAVQMAHSEFPPIVVTADDYIVDGNTRIEATLLRDQKFFPAIILNVPYRGGSEKQANELHALAATLNSMNGTPLTAKEIRLQAKAFIDLGWKSEQIARAIGVKAQTVTAVKKEIDAVTKLTRVGLNPNGAVKGASLRALGSKDSLALNDMPYKELAKLSADAGLNMGEIVSTAKEMKEIGSDSGQVERLSTLRVEFGDRIRQKELTGRGQPPVSRQLRQALGNVVKWEGREQELIETDPKVSDQHTAMIEKSVRVLTAVLQMQR